jgi:amino acid adenylation domain-containing protein
LTYESESWTFDQFNRRANQLARALRQAGVGPEDRVALVARRGFGMMVGIYGIAKAGGAWVPVDPTYPPARMEFLMADAAPRAVVLADAGLPPGLAGVEGLPVFDSSDPALAGYDDTNLPPVAGPRNLAYIIYTSGTTGHPKGVMVEHRSVVNYATHLGRAWQLVDEDIALQFSSYTFDAAILDHGIGVLTGHTLCLVPEGVLLDPPRFSDYVTGHAVTCGLIAPAYYVETGPLPTMRIVSTGGAAATPEIVARAAATGHYVNSYGPTEITVVAAEWHYDAGPGPVARRIPNPVPIGRPIGNAALYVLDGSRLAGVGMPGELCVGGVGVTRGYLHQPELTAERFIPNPFGPGRLYRTGDLVRWDLDGNAIYLGRIDDQVKIRGYRIEPAEIESAIRQFPGVRDAAVVARPGPGEASLHAYYTAAAAIPLADVRAHLAAQLPAYMVPASLTQVPSFPLNRAGKVDKVALDQAPSAQPRAHTRPRDPIETMIVTALGEALGVEDVGVADDFFELGGDSLSAIRLTTRLAGAGLALQVRDVFEQRTAAALAALARQIGAPATGSGGPIAELDPAPEPAAVLAPEPVPASEAAAVSASELVPASIAAPSVAAPGAAPVPPPPAPPAGFGSIDLDALVTEVRRAADRYAQRIVAPAPDGLDYPLSAAQRLSHRLGVLASFAQVDIDAPWQADRFARVWRGILEDHPILRSEIDLAAGLIRERELTAWGGNAIVHLDLADRPVHAVRHAIEHLSTFANPYTDPEHLGAPILTHRLVTVARPEAGFTVLLLVSHLAFDAISHDVLARRLVDGYQAGGAGVPDRRPYGDYLRFTALGPTEVDDAQLVRELDLERFAEAATEFARVAPSQTVDIEHDLAPGSPPEAIGALVTDALAQVFDSRPVPVALVAAGRNYRDANFAGYIGEFVDLVPLLVEPTGPGLLATATSRLAYLRRHNLVLASLLADPLIASRFPRAARALAVIATGQVPLLNIVLLGGPDRAAPVTDSQPAGLTAARASVINAVQVGGRLIVQGLPCPPELLGRFADDAGPTGDATRATPGPSPAATPGPGPAATPGPGPAATPGPSPAATPGPSPAATPGPGLRLNPGLPSDAGARTSPGAPTDPGVRPDPGPSPDSCACPGAAEASESGARLDVVPRSSRGPSSIHDAGPPASSDPLCRPVPFTPPPELGRPRVPHHDRPDCVPAASP